MTLTRSTVSGNSAFVSSGVGNGGGGILINGGTVALDGSTVSGNTTNQAGSGILINGGTVDLTSSTVSGNSGNLGNGIYIRGGMATLANTLVAGNRGQDCLLGIAGSVQSQGYNLIGNAGACSITPATGDQIGDPGNPIDALLAPLADYGGPTQTQALLHGSPAIDKGSCAATPTDQRGEPRPFDVPSIDNADDGCDIGALESHLGGTVNLDDGDVAGLVNAIHLANGNLGPDTIVLASGGAYTLTLVDHENTGGNGLPDVVSEILIRGNGATVQRNSASGAPEFRLFHVLPTGDLALEELTVSNGLAPDGGGILNQGNLNLNHATVSGNTANNGGGIWNGGTAALAGSTVSGNTADNGGGIWNDGTAALTSSTVSGNTANSGGGIWNDGTATLTSSTVSGNIANNRGGGMYNNSAGMVTLTSSTVSDNRATDGGGIFNQSEGAVDFVNTLIVNSGSAEDCGGDGAGNFNSLGHNMDSDDTCNLDGPGDMPNTRPVLSLLQDNGGPTQTHALFPGSPAIDAIPIEECTEATDQRGIPRPQGDGCDIGAVEVGPVLAGDHNCDGEANVLDIVLLLRHLVGLIPSLPVCAG